MGGSAAELNAFESTVEHFGPRRDPATRPILVGVDGTDTAMRAAAYALSAQIRAAAEELGVPVTFLKAYGDPYTTLREAADHCQVDTVVVGASTSAGHRIAGSVATKLIRAGHWPVLVVP